MDAWNIVVLGKLLRVERFTSGWRPCDENLDRVQAAEVIKLNLKLPNVLPDAEFGVPWELVVILELFLLFWLKVCELSLAQWNSFESIRGFHAEINA